MPRLRMHPNVACIYGSVQNVQNHGVAVRVPIEDLERETILLGFNKLVSSLLRLTVLVNI